MWPTLEGSRELLRKNGGNTEELDLALQVADIMRPSGATVLVKFHHVVSRLRSLEGWLSPNDWHVVNGELSLLSNTLDSVERLVAARRRSGENETKTERQA